MVVIRDTDETTKEQAYFLNSDAVLIRGTSDNNDYATDSILNYDANDNNITEQTDKTILKTLPFFTPSLFSNTPPTIRFSNHEQYKVEKPKKSIRKLLKWKNNSLLPKVCRRTLANSHFDIVQIDSLLDHSVGSPYWLGYWGRHWKTPEFKSILPYQKVNHFPGAFTLGRKDKLWTNIQRFVEKFPKNGYFNRIMPKTYILPRDGKILREKMLADAELTPYILKPPASARGTGVRVVHRWSQIPRKSALVVQNYIENPCLISGSKFDLRLYIYVTSFDPLKIYLYEDGLVRFASVKYSKNLSSISNRLMHLTNFSLNKDAAQDENIENKSETGVKWSLIKLWKYFEELGHNTVKLKADIVDLIIKSFICCETPINECIVQNVQCPWSCHELYGFDIILDDQLKPWLLEVNISPSLQASTELDRTIKTRLAVDVLNLAGLQLPEKYLIQSTSVRLAAEFKKPLHWYNADYRSKFSTKNGQLNLEKRRFFVENFQKAGKNDHSILDQLSGEDLRILIDLEDEFERKGSFRRVFPRQNSTSKYLRYFETVRYANLLLDEWLNQYYHIRETGVKLIESYCEHNLHIAIEKKDENTT